jgi:hypothetical protein
VHPKIVSDLLDNPEICDTRSQLGNGLSQKQLMLGRHINRIAVSRLQGLCKNCLTSFGCTRQVAFSADTAKATRWIAAHKTLLFQGHAARVADHLDSLAASFDAQTAETVRSEAAFLRNNARRMNYLEARENGWLIGSGSIESGCKQFQARLKGPGMRWSRPGAERMLAHSQPSFPALLAIPSILARILKCTLFTLTKRVSPRLCRGDTQSLTDPGRCRTSKT